MRPKTSTEHHRQVGAAVGLVPKSPCRTYHGPCARAVFFTSLGPALGPLALRLIVLGADSPGQRSRTAGNAAENELRWGAEAGFTCRSSGKHVHVQGLMAWAKTEWFVACTSIENQAGKGSQGIWQAAELSFLAYRQPTLTMLCIEHWLAQHVEMTSCVFLIDEARGL